MKLKVGDFVKDNVGRKGIILERARKPSASWLAAQNDRRMRKAAGPWWHVAPIAGGGILVPESLATRLRRATVDDVAKVMDADETDDGRATLLHLFAELRSRRRVVRRPKRASR